MCLRRERESLVLGEISLYKGAAMRGFGNSQFFLGSPKFGKQQREPQPSLHGILVTQLLKFEDWSAQRCKQILSYQVSVIRLA